MPFRCIYNYHMVKKKKKKVKRILLYIFVASVLALAVVIYAYPIFTEVLTKTSIVEYGNLKVTAKETCYFIRNEEVVIASAAGRIQYYIDEGEMVRKGTKIVDIASSGQNYEAEDNSLISYYIDGLEEVFSPEKMAALTKEKAEAVESEIKDIRRETAISGEPLYKAVDNGTWYIALWAEPDNVIKFKKGKTVYVNLPLGDIKGTTYDIIDSGGSWLVILKFNRFYEEMQRVRKIEAEVVTSDYEGLIVANSSITSLEGKPGVYRKDIKGEFIFTPVMVMASDGEYSLIEDAYFYEKAGDETLKIKTIDVYDEILNYPERMKDD